MTLRFIQRRKILTRVNAKRLAAVLIAMAVMFPSVYGLANNFQRVGASNALLEMDRAPRTLVAVPNGSYPEEVSTNGSADVYDEWTSPKVVVLMQAKQLVPEEGVLRTNLLVGLSAGARLLLRDQRAGDYVADTVDYDHSVLDKRYANMSLELRIKQYFGKYQETIEIPFKNLFSLRYAFESAYEVDLPVLGKSDSFPGDWYILDFFVEVSLPPTVFWEQDGEAHDLLPLAVYAESSFGMAGRTFTLYQDDTITDDNFARLGASIESDRSTRVFTYGVALLPFALGVVLLIYIVWGYISTNAKLKKRKEEPSQVLLESLAGVLATIPLRQILVPESIEGLTRVDLLLTLGISMIIAVTIIRLMQGSSFAFRRTQSSEKRESAPRFAEDDGIQNGETESAPAGASVS